VTYVLSGLFLPLVLLFVGFAAGRNGGPTRDRVASYTSAVLFVASFVLVGALGAAAAIASRLEDGDDAGRSALAAAVITALIAVGVLLAHGRLLRWLHGTTASAAAADVRAGWAVATVLSALLVSTVSLGIFVHTLFDVLATDDDQRDLAASGVVALAAGVVLARAWPDAGLAHPAAEDPDEG
jgi:hypothetical protein